MICRNADRSWLLLSQVEHARIAAEVAEVWGNAEVPPLPFADLLVSAIRHHDDGWADWEAAPTQDPATGGPRHFTEMPMPESTAIWTRSIEQAVRRQPLEAIWISKHFSSLAEQVRPSRRAMLQEKKAIDTFLIAQKGLRSKCRRAALPLFSSIPELEAGIETGWQWLKFFDLFSLWLCCAPPAEPHTFPLPGEASLLATPQTAADIVLAPWPLRPKLLTLSLSARRIINRKYANLDELNDALLFGSPTPLHWRLKIV